MSWESLPIELRCMILSFRYDIRNNACKKIQNKWKNVSAHEDTVIDIMLDLEVDANGMILTMWESTASILDFCCKKMSGKFNQKLWKILLESIREALLYDEVWAEETTFNETPNLKYYYKVESAYHEILNKIS